MAQMEFKFHSFLGKAVSLLDRIWSQCVVEYLKMWQRQSLEAWKLSYSLRPLSSICCHRSVCWNVCGLTVTRLIFSGRITGRWEILDAIFSTPASYLTSPSCLISGTLWGLLVKAHYIDSLFFSLKYGLIFKYIFSFFTFPLPLKFQGSDYCDGLPSTNDEEDDFKKNINPLPTKLTRIFSFLVPVRTDKDCFTREEQGSDYHFHTIFVSGLWAEVKEPVTLFSY